MDAGLRVMPSLGHIEVCDRGLRFHPLDDDRTPITPNPSRRAPIRPSSRELVSVDRVEADASVRPIRPGVVQTLTERS